MNTGHQNEKDEQQGASTERSKVDYTFMERLERRRQLAAVKQCDSLYQQLVASLLQLRPQRT